MSTVGDILSTVGIQMIQMDDIMSTLYQTQITKDYIPHGTEHPSCYSRYPHIYHESLNGTEHPARYSRYSPGYKTQIIQGDMYQLCELILP